MVERSYVPYPKANPGCILVEQRAYDHLKSMWDGLLPITKVHAIDGMRKFIGSFAYSSLEALVIEYAPVDGEMKARELAKQGFKP